MTDKIKYKNHFLASASHIKYEIPYVEARLKEKIESFNEIKIHIKDLKNEIDDMNEWLDFLKKEELILKMAGIK